MGDFRRKMKIRMEEAAIENRKSRLSYKKDFQKNWSLYLFILPVLAWYIVFCYGTMYGQIIGFKDFRVAKGILGSEWIGFKNIHDFLQYPEIARLFINTIRINLVSMLFWPADIIFALLLNELRWAKYKKVTQTISIFPHFITNVVTCTVIRKFCMSDGVFGMILSYIGVEPVNLLTVPDAFVWILQLKGLWQGIGWGSIIYLSAMAGVDKECYESAQLDGATRIQRMRYITVPGIAPTITIMLIMRAGSLLSVGAGDILLLYNPTIYSTADVVSTYMFRQGLEKMNFAYSGGIGIFNNIISFLLTFGANAIARRVSDTNLF